MLGKASEIKTKIVEGYYTKWGTKEQSWKKADEAANEFIATLGDAQILYMEVIVTPVPDGDLNHVYHIIYSEPKVSTYEKNGVRQT